jgi:flagellar basal-body rod protein FlgC
MKINNSFFGLNISSHGMSIQRKKMDLISQNIANADTVRTQNGDAYKRKYLKVEADQNSFASNLSFEGQQLRLNTTEENHFSEVQSQEELSISENMGKASLKEMVDQKPGEMIYMPGNPDANEQGYVQTSNVSVVNEMVDMIAATRSYEANLQALNSTKQLVKDSLEI